MSAMGELSIIGRDEWPRLAKIRNVGLASSPQYDHRDQFDTATSSAGLIHSVRKSIQPHLASETPPKRGACVSR